MAEDRKEKNQWLDVVTKLIKLTQKGELKWVEATRTDLPKNSDRITAVFVTEYKGKRLRLYATKERNNIPFDFWGKQEWYEIPFLEFITQDGKVLWEFPSVDALSDLLTTVQYKVAGVQEFLSDILEEEFAR